jgi:hypothetical protein
LGSVTRKGAAAAKIRPRAGELEVAGLEAAAVLALLLEEYVVEYVTPRLRAGRQAPFVCMWQTKRIDRTPPEPEDATRIVNLGVATKRWSRQLRCWPSE